MLRAGERSVAAGSTATALEAKDKGEPIDVLYPSDGCVIIVAPSAIIKGCKHPNAAKLFMEFMMSPQASEIAATRSQDGLYASIGPRAASRWRRSRSSLPSRRIC